MSKYKKTVTYNGKDYTITKSYEFNGRTYYWLEGLQTAVSERSLDDSNPASSGQ